MEIISVIIADDHIIFRKGLRTVLNEIDNIKVIGEASNGNELLELLKTDRADVILMDIKMPYMDGIAATKKISEKYPDTKIIALTMHEEIGYFNEMISSGALGFLLKKTNKEELEKALNKVACGDNYFSEEFIGNLNKRTEKNIKSTVKLSEREQEILEFICKGLSNIEMAAKLGLSQKTIDGHRARLFEKTGAVNAPNLVMFAVKNGLIKTQ